MNDYYGEFFPNSSESDQDDWQWQIENSITKIDEIEKIIKKKIEINKINLPIKITPYYLKNFYNKDNHPLLKTIIPSNMEYIRNDGELEDPLCEDKYSPVQNLVHKYPDRVLLLATNFCSTYCRYCTRSRKVGKQECCKYDDAIKYIQDNKVIRDVLISGGDPLILQDNIIESLLNNIRKIEHVEIIRIGTKIPVVLPQRITNDLVDILKRYHPFFMSIHFTHPDEITDEVKQACCRLADAGIPLLSQTVLLKDINDNAETLKKLFTKLLTIRVRPYYLYQCDPIIGSKHFRVSLDKALDILYNIRGNISGFAVPNFVIDTAGGKLPILNDYILEKNDNMVICKNYKGDIYTHNI